MNKYEPVIRLSIFLGGFALFANWQLLSPHLKLPSSKLKRWITNFALIATSTLLVRFVIPTAAVAVAYLVEKITGASPTTLKSISGLTLF